MKLNQEKILTNTQIRIITKVNKTENLNKVKTSIKNMIRKDIKIIRESDYLIVEDDLNLLENIKNQINKNEYNTLCYNILASNRNDSTTRFYINKQCALNDLFHISDVDLSQLGDIEIELQSNNMDEVIKWVCEY